MVDISHLNSVVMWWNKVTGSRVSFSIAFNIMYRVSKSRVRCDKKVNTSVGGIALIELGAQSGERQ
jgi:hypothetical protein